MIIPLRTDAPIYHFPWATLGLIVANVVTFFMTAGGEQSAGWLLEYGNGLHPVQWVACNFLHFGLMHLLGNMVFLWGFGLVIEGKLGWLKFLAVYFGIGVIHAACEQVMMLGYETSYLGPSGSGGASGIIFGLLAMSMVWAPKNEVTCLLFVFFRPFTFDVTILTFALFYVAL